MMMKLRHSSLGNSGCPQGPRSSSLATILLRITKMCSPPSQTSNSGNFLTRWISINSLLESQNPIRIYMKNKSRLSREPAIRCMLICEDQALRTRKKSPRRKICHRMSAVSSSTSRWTASARREYSTHNMRLVPLVPWQISNRWIIDTIWVAWKRCLPVHLSESNLETLSVRKVQKPTSCASTRDAIVS